MKEFTFKAHSLRDTMQRHNELYNLQSCESPREAELYDRCNTPAHGRLAAVCFGWTVMR